MELTQQEFEHTFKGAIDEVLEAMAEHEAVNLDKFYSMTCILENLAFFSPVIYGVLKEAKEK